MDSRIKPQSILELVSSVVSAVLFAVSTLLGWFLPNSGLVMFIAGLVLIIAILLLYVCKTEKAIVLLKAVISFSVVICVLSGIALLLYRHAVLLDDENKLLCDFTEEAISIDNSQLDWLNESEIVGNRIRYFYAPTEQDISTSELANIVINTTLLSDGDVVPLSRHNWNQIGSNYSLTILRMDKAKPTLDNSILCPLPYSVNLTVCGYMHLNRTDWTKAKDFFLKGDKECNGVASYYLYVMYKNGCGMKPSLDTAVFYLERSSKLGYRKAQLEYGQYLFNKGNSSDIFKGAEYLLNASLLSEYRTVYAMRIMEKSIEMLQEYYWKTGQYKEAYNFTK